MPKPRNLRNDVSAQFVQRHVVGDQRLIRIAGELHRRQPRVPIRRNHRRYRDGTIKIRIRLLFIDRLDTARMKNLSMALSMTARQSNRSSVVRRDLAFARR